MEKGNQDCYGLHYDPLLAPCRDYCAVRDACRETVRHRLKTSAKELTATLARRNAPPDWQPEISSLVSEIIDHCESLGMRAHFKRYYLVFKDRKRRSLLHCSRLQTRKVYGSLRFVRIRERDDFPEAMREWVSFEKCCGQHYFTGTTMDELRRGVSAYLNAVNAREV